MAEAAHTHILIKVEGRITCDGCSLDVVRPKGMPDYSKAVMKRW